MDNGAIAVRSQVSDILAEVLDVSPDLIDDGFSSDSCSAWDSVKHLTLVLAIEDRFGITFDEEEMWTLTSFPSLLQSVQKRLPV